MTYAVWTIASVAVAIPLWRDMATEPSGVVPLEIWVRTVWFAITEWPWTVLVAWLGFTGVVLAETLTPIYIFPEWAKSIVSSSAYPMSQPAVTVA